MLRLVMPLVMVVMLLTVRLLRAAPTQCVTLMPGHVRPERRVVVSIIHRLLKKKHKRELSFRPPQPGASTTHHEFFVLRRCPYPRWR